MLEKSLTDKPNRLETPKTGTELGAVAPIVAKTAIELAGVPVVGSLANAVVDLMKERTDRLRESMHRQSEERLSRFYSEMLDAEATMDEKVARAMIDDADFHALLRACVADIEAEKVGAYAALARGIATGTVDKRWRRHFILSLRDLSAEELESLRGAFVARESDLIPRQGSTMGQEHFLNAGQPGSHQAILINNLATRGFVHEGKLSPTGVAFTTACWRSDQLTAGSLGYRQWSGHNVAILNYEIGNGSMDRLATRVQDALRAAAAKSFIAAVDRNNWQQARMMSTMSVLLVGSRSERIQENLEHLSQFAGKVPMLLVLVDEQGTEPAGLPVFERLAVVGKDLSEVAAEICSLIVRKSREQKAAS